MNIIAHYGLQGSGVVHFHRESEVASGGLPVDFDMKLDTRDFIGYGAVSGVFRRDWADAGTEPRAPRISALS